MNISSIATRAVPLLTGYGAAKAGLEAMSRTMAAEWGQYEIRVNAVAPGTVKTPRAGQDDLNDAAAKILCSVEQNLKTSLMQLFPIV